MSSKRTVFKIFVIGPSDTNDEREIAKSVIQRVNALVGSGHNAMLEYLGWDTDVLAGIGDDGQDVINRSIGNNYDAVVGFLWSRLGSPTARADSGTVEEYELALERASKREINHVLWFIRNEDIDPRSTDLEQLKKANEFIERVRHADGCLTLDYTMSNLTELLLNQFSTLLTTLLSEDRSNASYDGDISFNNASAISETIISDGEVIVSEAPEASGILDFRLDLDESAEEFTHMLAGLSDSMGLLGSIMDESAVKVKSASAGPNSPSAKSIMKILDDPIEALELFSSEVEIKLPRIEASFMSMVSSMNGIKLINLEAQNQSAILENNAAIDSLLKVNSEVKSSMAGFLESLRASPMLSKKYRKANNKAIRSVERLIRFLESSAQQLSGIR